MQPEVHAEMAAVQQRHWWFVARRRILAAVVEGLQLPHDARILELGCGSGGNLALLARFGQLQAVELDDQARALAQALKVCPVQAGGLPDDLPDDLHSADGSFDLVCLLDVLEHVADDGAALARVARLLKPGGRVLLTLPAYAWLWSAHDEAHHHHRRYRATQLRSRAAAAGLRPLRLGYFNSLLFPLIALVRLAGRLTGRSGASDAALPGPLINRALQAVFALERHVLPHVLFPAGTSVLAVLSRADQR